MSDTPEVYANLRGMAERYRAQGDEIRAKLLEEMADTIEEKA